MCVQGEEKNEAGTTAEGIEKGQMRVGEAKLCRCVKVRGDLIRGAKRRETFRQVHDENGAFGKF